MPAPVLTDGTGQIAQTTTYCVLTDNLYGYTVFSVNLTYRAKAMARRSIRMSNINSENQLRMHADVIRVPAGVPSKYRDLTWNAIRRQAADRGVAVLGRKRNEIEADLVKLDQAS